jgi:methylphosphotriester-DNA--protein-cysteine methyltransferase
MCRIGRDTFVPQWARRPRSSVVWQVQHVCRLWDTGQTLTEIAFEVGYCDQPHMVRDFRLFTGTSPEELFRSVHPRNLPIFYK